MYSVLSAQSFISRTSKEQHGDQQTRAQDSLKHLDAVLGTRQVLRKFPADDATIATKRRFPVSLEEQLKDGIGGNYSVLCPQKSLNRLPKFDAKAARELVEEFVKVATQAGTWLFGDGRHTGLHLVKFITIFGFAE